MRRRTQQQGEGAVRKVSIFANWKMNMGRFEAVRFVQRLVSMYGARDDLELAICAPYPYLGDLVTACGDSRIGIGAQNMHQQEAGAFTGEVSVSMLTDVGCRYVLLGHSERRSYCRESDGAVNRKAILALARGLIPIVCIGETSRERDAGVTFEVLERQVKNCLGGIAGNSRLWLAYEPRWAIGAGCTPDSREICDVLEFLRTKIIACCGRELSSRIPLLYGGSVNEDNSRQICSLEPVDGVGCGGCSLDFECFSKGIEEAVAGSRTRDALTGEVR